MPRVNQEHLVKKIYHYYLQSIASSLSTDKDKQKNIDCVINYRGWCHGFAVCHAAMHATGQGDWWDDVIEELSGIDINKSFPKLLRVQGKLYKTTYLVDLVFSNIRMGQGILQLDNPDTSTISQEGHLLPLNAHPLRFEIVVPDPDNPGRYKIKKIGSQAGIGGHFTHPLLLTILEKNKALFEKNICLFSYGTSKGAHTCNLRYQEPYWFFYDPNFPNGAIKFTTLDHLVKTMLGNQITPPVLSRCQLYLHSLVSIDETPSPLTFNLSDEDFLALINNADFNRFHRFQFIHPLLRKKLEAAIKQNNSEFIYKIIDTPVFNDKILAILSRNKDFYQAIRTHLKTLNYPSGRTLLHVAICENANELVEEMLQAGCDSFQQDADGNTPLFYAVRTSRKAVHLLLDNGARGDVSNKNNETLFHYAVCQAHLTTQDLDRLIAEGDQLEARDSMGNTPLFWAVLHHHPRIKYLIDRGAKLNVQNKAGETLLHAAAKTNALSIVDELLRLGLDPLQKNTSGKSPFQIAAQQKSTEFAHRLVHHLNKQGKAQGKTLLHIAINEDARKLVEELLQSGFDFSQQDADGYTPFMLAIKLNRLECTQILLAYWENQKIDKATISAAINRPDNFGQTPLHFAVTTTHALLIKTLITKGANLEARDNLGRTPLFYAVSHSREATTILLNHGAKVDVTCKKNETPFHFAVCNKHFTQQDLDRLIALGARLEARDHVGNTPFAWAVMYFDLWIKYLMDRGAKLNTVNNDGETLLHAAARANALIIVDELLRIGLDPLQKNFSNESPFQIALQEKSTLFANRLFHHIIHKQGNGDRIREIINFPDVASSNFTFFYWTIINNHQDLFDSFISMGADWTLCDADGRTVLHWAVRCSRFEMIKKLMALGADCETKDLEGNTPLDVAKEGKNAEIIAYFTSKRFTQEYKQKLGELIAKDEVVVVETIRPTY